MTDADRDRIVSEIHTLVNSEELYKEFMDAYLERDVMGLEELPEYLVDAYVMTGWALFRDAICTDMTTAYMMKEWQVHGNDMLQYFINAYVSFVRNNPDTVSMSDAHKHFIDIRRKVIMNYWGIRASWEKIFAWAESVWMDPYPLLKLYYLWRYAYALKGDT